MTLPYRCQGNERGYRRRYYRSPKGKYHAVFAMKDDLHVVYVGTRNEMDRRWERHEDLRDRRIAVRFGSFDDPT